MAKRDLCLIIRAYGFMVNPFFRHQLEHRLKEVDIKAWIGINGAQQGQFLRAFKAIITDGMAHNRPVLLLDMCLVVFFW